MNMASGIRPSFNRLYKPTQLRPTDKVQGSLEEKTKKNQDDDEEEEEEEEKKDSKQETYQNVYGQPVHLNIKKLY